MPTTWQILVDWDRDGKYTLPGDNITGDVIDAKWFLGMKRLYQDTADDSQLELVLDNSDRNFSPELHNNVAPFCTVCIQSIQTIGVVQTTRTHWVGWIEEIQPDVNRYGKRLARITAAGPMMFCKGADTDIALQENQRTDAIIDLLVKQVVIPPALSNGWFLDMRGYSELDYSTHIADTTMYATLDTGLVTLAIAADNWVQSEKLPNDPRDTFNVYRAIADVAAAERGRFLFDREGKAIFWNRLRLQDEIPSSATLDDTMNDLQYTFAGIDNFKNEVIVACHPRTVGATTDEVLWELADETTIPAGQTYSIGVKYHDTDDGRARVGGKDITITDITFTSGEAAVTLGSISATSATLKVVNSGTIPAVLSKCTVKGRKITDYGRMEATGWNGTSIANYGRRSLTMNLLSVDNFEYAQYIADYEATRRGQARGIVGQVTLKTHGTNDDGDIHTQQLACTLGDVVTISETQTGHGHVPDLNNNSYVIIGESHHLTEGASLLETTWYLEPAAEAPFPWKLDVAGRAELGTATQLAF